MTTQDTMDTQSGSTASAEEVARFAAMAEQWWDPDGKFRPLHAFNPVRLAFIRDTLCGHFGRDSRAVRPLEGLRIVDIGCGGGLVAEPVANMGAQVLGIDAGEKNIGIARAHAEGSGATVSYRHVLPETLAAEGARFDVVLNLEVIEHVADVSAYLAATAALLAPGGVMVLATLNRTLKALLLAKLGAEYVLRWLPIGTHDWNKFVRPSELANELRPQGLRVIQLQGVSYNPLSSEWRLSEDLDVNYMAVAVAESA